MTSTQESPGQAANLVARLVVRERQCRDRGWWDDWAGCFTDDSFIDMSWFTGSGADFVDRTRERSAKGVWGRHRLSPPSVTVRGSRACVEVPLAIEFRILVGAVEADLVSYCRSQYRAIEIDGDWRISRITSVYERDSLVPAVPGATIDLSPDRFAAYRPSYRCLAWYLERQGDRVADDLLGDDRPGPVTALCAAEKAWIDSSPLTPAVATSPSTKEH